MNSFDPYGNNSVVRADARSSSEVRMLGWNIPPEELQYIPEHWLKYEEPPDSVHYLIGLLFIFYMLLALPGNGLVLYIFSTSKALRTPSNVLVINLAFCDFLMMSMGPIVIYNSFHKGYVLGHAGCQLAGVITSYAGIGAGMTNAAIAYDRYNVITSPMEGRMSMTKAVVIVVLIYVYCTPWVLAPYTMIWNKFVPEGFLTGCTFDYITDDFDTRLFVGMIFSFSLVLPTCAILYFYKEIVGHVFSHEKQLREQAKKMNVDSLRSNTGDGKDTAELRIAKAAITVCFLFFFSWVPYGTMALTGAFGDKSLLTPSHTMIPMCTCKLVACIDPYVYAISHPRYRMELQKRLPWLSIVEKAPESASVTSTSTINTAEPQQTTAT